MNETHEFKEYPEEQIQRIKSQLLDRIDNLSTDEVNRHKLILLVEATIAGLKKALVGNDTLGKDTLWSYLQDLLTWNDEKLIKTGEVLRNMSEPTDSLDENLNN